jgi:hypothetical protein
MQQLASSGRRELAERLRARRSEIEQIVRTRIYAIAEPSEVSDPEYGAALRGAVSSALDYGLQGVERGEERAPPVPVALLAQARLAVRSGVNLDTVLRRYFAGYSLLGDFLVRCAQGSRLGDAELQQVLREQAALFDRLLAAVTQEYDREASAGLETRERRLAVRVQRLLDGELIDVGALPYDFDGHHLGVVATGPGVTGALREMAAYFDRRLLLVRPDEERTWAWLGGRRAVATDKLTGAIAELLPADACLALSQPSIGLEGWRLAHRQAATSLPIARQEPGKPIQYADVAVLASALHDDLLSTSLRELYLAPLARERDRGASLRETLGAYFAADRNVSSAAAVLGTSRNTVAARLATVERLVGRPLSACGSDLELALSLHAIGVAGTQA